MNYRSKRFAAVLLMLVMLFSSFTLGASAAEATVSLSAGDGGTLSVTVSEGGTAIWNSGSVSGSASNTITYSAGYDITITATANSGYSVASITAGGTAYTGTNTVSLTGQTAATLDVSATFSVSTVTYSLATQAVTDGTATPTGGSVTTGGSYAGGAAVSLTATPAEGYYFSGWSCDNGSFSSTSDKSTTFTMPASNCTVSANFKKLAKHKLTLGDPDNGKLSIGNGFDNSMTSNVSGEYYPGDVIRLVSEADKGYILNYWFTDGSGTLDSRYYYATDFVMPDTDVTVSAVFVKSVGSESEKEENKPSANNQGGATTTTPAPETESPSADTLYIITTEASTGGTVVVSETTAKSGATVTVTATANEGYTFSGWLSTAGGSFEDAKALSTTFTMPAADTTVVATFVAENGGATVHPTDDDDKKDDEGGKKGGFPWLWVGIGAAAVALIVGIIAVVIDRKNKDDGYDEPEETFAMTAKSQKPRRKKLFKKRENRFDPEDEDPTYNDAFFDDF